MKTPMQEMLEWVRATLPMDLDFPQMIERKIESLREKEKEQIKKAYRDHHDLGHLYELDGEQYYNETFNTKEK